MSDPTFIIEHLESEMWQWCEIEYENAARLVKPYKLIVSNTPKAKYNFGKNSQTRKESVIDMKIDWKKVCVLDPKAERELVPADRNEFDFYVFGGILGDAQFNGRTGEELTSKLPTDVALRHIGNRQFSTDNAVLVTKMILDGKKLSEIKLQDGAEVNIADGEDVLLPYCYPIINGKPQMSDKLIEYLKQKKEF